jgi:hypothetical protein
MTLVVDIFRRLIPARAKPNPSGWTSFNAPCCQHRGHKPDTRKRAGLRFDTGIVYNCFNCKFTASWQPGRGLSERFKNLCRWLNASDDDINAMMFEALKTEAVDYQHKVEERIEFTEKELPKDTVTLLEAMESNPEQTVPIAEYLMGRGFDLTGYDYLWSPELADRVIIPFAYKGKIVGWTARKIRDGRPKYLSDQHPHFVFNIDSQQEDQRYIFVLEGPFDAVSLGGVALLTNDVAEQQSRMINSLGHQVIVVPDQDRAGLVLIDRAIENGWSVAFPNWEDDVKDAAEAVARYGRLFVTVDCILTAVEGEIKLSMARKQLENKIKRLENE